MKNIIRTLFGLAILSFVISCDALPGTKRGNKAPAFTLKDIAAQPHSLEDYQGKAVMLHFWTDWCNSCRAEFPRVQTYYAELQKTYGNFELLAINVGQPLNTSKEFKQSFDITFPMLADTQGIMKDIYNVEAFPTNYFISPDGKIVRKIIGWVHKKQVREFIELYEGNEPQTATATLPSRQNP